MVNGILTLIKLASSCRFFDSSFSKHRQAATFHRQAATCHRQAATCHRQAATCHKQRRWTKRGERQVLFCHRERD